MIRKATAADLDRAEAIYHEILDHQAATVNYTNWIKGVYPTREDARRALEAGTFFVMEEDGQVVVHFTFEFNDSIIEIHQPEETWHSGKHSVMLYYPIENLVANYRNIFNVYARATGGTVTVDTGDCLAAIMGQSMGAGEAWDGEIRIEETIKKVKLGGVLQMTAVDENIIWKIDELVKRTYSDVVHGRFGIGAFAMPVER